MKQLGIAAVITAALASAASIAVAQWNPPQVPLCCACLEGVPHGGQTAQIGPPGATAIFCAAAPDGNTTALAARCEAETNGSDPSALSCIEASSNATCRQDLAGAGIACPNAGVPAVDALNLATLAVLLGATGALVLRRRGRRDA